MAYDSRNPKKNSIILVDEAGTPANPPAGATKLITRSNVLYHRNSAGTEVAVLTGASATQTSAKSADYTVTDTDNIRTVLMTTGASNRTVTLPTAADNTHRIITVKKVDSGAGLCTVDGEGSEAVYGGSGSGTTFVLYHQYDYVTLQCDGTGWHVIACNSFGIWRTVTMTGTWSTNTTYTCKARRNGSDLELDAHISLAGAPTSASLTLTLPESLNIDTSGIAATGALSPLGDISIRDAGNATYLGRTLYQSSTVVAAFVADDSATGVVFNAVTQAVPIAFGSGDFVYAHLKVPCAEYAHFR